MNKHTTEIINAQRKKTLTRRQKQLLKDVVDAVLDYEHVTVPCEVSLTLVSGARIRKLNKTFRDIDRETDVLSFPSGDWPAAENAETCFLGDIVISAERAFAQAEEYGHSFERELGFLCAHSTLHLLGYDHMTESEEIDMFARQEAVLAKMGLVR